MAKQQTFRDPVEKSEKQREEKNLIDEAKKFDIANISLEDFRPIAESAARAPHPFDGYPERLIKVGDTKKGPLMVPAYSIVALNPKEYVFQDPSGNKVSVTDQKTKREKIVTLKTHHNVMFPDYENGGQNTKIVFDRTLPLANGQVLESVAFVFSHSLRAQLLFKLDQKGERIQADRRYVLYDIKQTARLRRIFEMIVNPKIANNRLAKWVSGESEEEPTEIQEE